MKKILMLLVIALAATSFAGQPFASTQSSTAVSGQDGNFVRDVALDNQLQIKMSQMAIKKGSNPDVKDFAQRMVKDTSKHHQELKSIAQRKGIPVPTELDRQRQMKMDEVAKKSGAEFDREYISMMAPDHRTHIDMFTNEVSKGKDPDLKSFAVRELPKLKEHQSELERLQPQVAKKS